jgi:hypothetical protein
MVSIKLISENITIPLMNRINITSGDSDIQGFSGVLNLDFREHSAEFIPAGSDLKIEMELENIRIRNVKIPKLTFSSVDFDIISEKTNMSASDENIEIFDFSGDIEITTFVMLSGNVSKAKDDTWSIG